MCGGQTRLGCPHGRLQGALEDCLLPGQDTVHYSLLEPTTVAGIQGLHAAVVIVVAAVSSSYNAHQHVSAANSNHTSSERCT
jgi:hypothetical protein